MNIRIMSIGLLLLALALLSACSKDKTSDDNFQLYMTDAPVDDPQVKAVFITVTELRVDGQAVEGFTATTFDISAYQKGATKLLAKSRLEPGTYQDLTLVLDYSQTANGQTPGSWVEEQNGTKHPLQSTSAEFQLAKNFTITDDGMTDLVVDLDLRKAIRRENVGGQKYNLVGHTDLKSAMRLLVKGETGVIDGTCNDPVTSSDKIIVYAYQKGTYNALLEKIEVQGVAFVNAVNSAAVDANGHYEMHFLPPGNYELVFIAYKDLNTDGEMDLQGTLLLNVLTGQELKTINVQTNASATVNVQVTGLIPI